jgi:hypothetical protein
MLKSKTITGRENRETFSAEINSYISQTRVYNEYFNDYSNRKFVQDKYGISIVKPKRVLVMGRRYNFSNDEWLEIKSDYSNLDIYTYDDLIDGVMSTLYII